MSFRSGISEKKSTPFGILCPPNPQVICQFAPNLWMKEECIGGATIGLAVVQCAQDSYAGVHLVYFYLSTIAIARHQELSIP